MDSHTTSGAAGHRNVPARLIETADGIEVRCSCHGSNGHLLFRLVGPNLIQSKCRDHYIFLEVLKAQEAFAKRSE